MHLFLTSSPCEDNVPEGVNLPCIFFERNSFVSNLRSRVKTYARLVVVAADPEAFDLNDEMTQTFESCFIYHGMMLSSVELLDARTMEYAAELIDRSDIVLLGGGHVPTENAFFEAIGLRELLEGYPGVVIGISAGSMNCASTVYAQPENPGESIDPDYERFIPGLNLTDVMILPHYQKVRNFMLDGRRLYEDITYPDSFGCAFIAIPDGSYVLQEHGKALLFGEGYCICEGRKVQICREGGCVELSTLNMSFKNKSGRRINPAHITGIMELTNGCPYYSLLGIRLVELGSGYARMEMEVDPARHMNPFGSVHGGAYASMIDCATYWAAYCDQDEDAGFTTLDISVSDLAMAKAGKLTVTARAIKEGRSVCLCEAEVKDEKNRIVAFGTSKLLMLKGRQSIADALKSQGKAEIPAKFLD